MNDRPQTSDGDGCLQDEQFAAWQADALTDDERAHAVTHTAHCARCRAILGELIRVPQGGTDDRIGRYEIVDTIGSGGMGVVLRAYDPLLNREVAVKVCRQRADHEIEREVLLSEARKLALVRQQNVVPVYDVGIQGDEIYIAMELVDGLSLAEWVTAEQRSVSQRLEIARGIGRGLRAIHDAGLVHRDLKPSNVMVRADGSAVVVDLGLAEHHVPGRDVIARPAGTRGYLPPEVKAGAPATPRSDQYQWWSLMRDPLALERQLSWLSPLIDRGTSKDPAARFHSVDAGLRAIERASMDSRRSRWPVALVSVAAIIGLVAAWFAWQRGDASAAADCTEKVGWKADTRDRVTSVLREHGAPAQRIVAAIDERAKRAQALTTELCRESKDGDELAWRRRECVLEAWRGTARAIVDIRDSEAATDVMTAIDDLAEVLPIERCDKGTVLAVPAPLSAAQQQVADEGLASIHAAMADPSGTMTDKKSRLAKLRERTASLGNPAVMAEWHVELGRVYAAAASRKEASESFATAYALASEAGADELAAATLVMQLTVVPKGTSADAVEQLAAHARAAVDKVGSPYWRSQLSRAIATHAMVTGDNDRAVREFRSGISALEALRLVPHQMELSMKQNLGAILIESGDPNTAATVLADAVAGAKLRWLSTNPDLYWTLRAAHATALLASGKTEAAADVLAEVVSGLDAIGAAPYQQGMVQSYRAAALMSLRRVDEARVAADRAVELVAKDAGDSPVLVWPLLSAAQVALAQKDWLPGKQHLVRAQAICGGGSCRDIEILVLETYLAIALKHTGDASGGRRLARKVRDRLAQPGFEKAHSDLVAAFPELKE